MTACVRISRPLACPSPRINERPIWQPYFRQRSRPSHSPQQRRLAQVYSILLSRLRPIQAEARLPAGLLRRQRLARSYFRALAHGLHPID